jgi:hypothetical protein
MPSSRALGVPDTVSDSLDAVLARAAVGTGASIVALQPGRLQLTDDVGALLRYTLPG